MKALLISATWIRKGQCWLPPWSFCGCAVKEDRCLTIESLAAPHRVSLHHSQDSSWRSGPRKKTARWVPRLLSTDKKEERVNACSELIAVVKCHSMAMMDQIVTMDETMVCYHTPETKRQLKQWVKRGQPGSIKAKVHASRMNQVVMAFFDSKGLIYTTLSPMASLSMPTTLSLSWAHLWGIWGKNDLIWQRSSDGFIGTMHQCTWPPVSRTGELLTTSRCCGTRLFCWTWRQPIFFCSTKWRRHWLANVWTRRAWKNMGRGHKIHHCGVRRLPQRCEKCIHIDGDYVEKFWEINMPLSITIVDLFKQFRLLS